MPRYLPAILFCTLALAGCITTADPVPTPVATVEPIKGPAACAQPIGDYVNVIEADVTSGHLNRDVHRRITNDLFGVRSHAPPAASARRLPISPRSRRATAIGEMFARWPFSRS